MCYRSTSLIEIRHPAKFSDNKQCGGGDITFLVAEEPDSKHSCLNPSLLFISV